MPVYHSKKNDEPGYPESCGCLLAPFRTDIRGPSGYVPEGEYEDIIDETLSYFRANVLFRNFEIKGTADRTLIYLTLFTVFCLQKCERIEDKNSAIRELRALAIKQFSIPGDHSFPLPGIFPASESRNETDAFRAYFKQAREELAIRLCDRLFNSDGTKNKWWQSFSKKKFMNKELDA